ncbi:cytochrome b [Methylophaga sp. SB9B]|uniref:cytochrome b n=1 Tax=Methylophaga sp. SB9B TaxID=2570356 RepID=UPI0010A8FB1D|nr:cytochrome b [Methylophaga sp. SB9B]THK41570.1 cytochrome b [Methylophaga sp. SB9B]
MSMNDARYDQVQIILHWIIAAMIFFMLGLGLWMVGLPMQSELPPDEESVRAFWFLLHKSMGITVAAFVILRIVWRLTHKAPPLPASIPTWQQRVSSLVHYLLYGLMIAMPITGYLQSMYSKYDTKLWGITLPRLAEADAVARETFTDIHQILAYLFIAVLVLHIGAALKHRLKGTEVTSRMSLWK